MFTGFWWVILLERNQWGDPDVDGRIVIKWKEVRDVQRVLVSNPEGKRPLVRLRHR
jgi:hypothetical protein